MGERGEMGRDADVCRFNLVLFETSKVVLISFGELSLENLNLFGKCKELFFCYKIC